MHIGIELGEECGPVRLALKRTGNHENTSLAKDPGVQMPGSETNDAMRR